MNSVVVPVEESREPTWAIDYVCSLYSRIPLCIHLLNVRHPLPEYVARFIPRVEREAYHRENGLRAMRAAIERLDARGIAHHDHVRVGRKAETIVRFARDHDCSEIVVDKPGSLLEGLGLGSIQSQLRHLLRPGDPCRLQEGA
jgi:nucleotide-binding universal stress UspA family protein